jgi:protocatechuate 3,4-dioxygenase beta subunit
MVLAATSLLALLAPAGSPSNAQARCEPTKPDMLGPFYTPNAPERTRTGQGLVIAGRVLSAPACAPLAGARVEWWSANTRGDYDDAHRATGITDPEGRYRYETDFPGRYEPRPQHVHVRVSASGHRTLVTQIYPTAGQTSVQTDFVLVRQ